MPRSNVTSKSNKQTKSRKQPKPRKKRSRKPTQAQKNAKKRADLNKSIEAILTGDKSTGLKGLSIIKSKRAQNILRQAVYDAANTGITLASFKNFNKIGKNFTNIVPRNLKQQTNNRQRAKKFADIQRNIIMNDIAKHNFDPNQTQQQRITYGNDVVDFLIQAGYDPENYDMRAVYRGLDNTRLKNTRMLEIVDGHYQTAYSWVVVWLADHIEQFAKTEL